MHDIFQQSSEASQARVITMISPFLLFYAVSPLSLPTSFSQNI